MEKLNMEKLNNLILDLESDCKEVREMIIDRIQSTHFSDEGLRQAFMEDPYTLELSLEDADLDQMHSYDLGRLEAFEEIANALKKIINE
jgi:hypothetical protein